MRDRLAQPLSVTKRYAQFLQVILGKLGDDIETDVVLEKYIDVLVEPDAA